MSIQDVLKELRSFREENNTKLMEMSESLNALKITQTAMRVDVDRNTESISNLQRELALLKSQNMSLAGRLERCDSYVKRKNIIVYNFSSASNDREHLIRSLVSFFGDKLKAEIEVSCIISAYTLGSKIEGRNQPIRVIFADVKSKWEILSKAKNLGRDCAVSLSQDYTPARYLQQKKLRHYKNAMKNEGVEAKIKGLSLEVDGERLNLAQLE